MYKQLKILILSITAVSFIAVASDDDNENDGMSGSKIAPKLDVIDVDGDGKVSKQEFDQYRNAQLDSNSVEETQRSVSAFASFDKDKDGFVTEEELAAHAKYSNPGNGTGELSNDKSNKNKEKKDKRSKGKGKDK